MTPGRVLRSLARARAKARRMNELALVVKTELERHAPEGGEFHDVSGVHEIRYEQRDYVGFRPE